MSKAKSQYDSLQKKMQETLVEATSGGGTVTAKMDGRKQLLSLHIDPEAVGLRHALRLYENGKRKAARTIFARYDSLEIS